MKGFVSAAMSAVLAYNSAVYFNVSAADIDPSKYTPTFSMTYTLLKNQLPYKTNRLYINKNTDRFKKGSSVSLGVFYLDESKSTDALKASVQPGDAEIILEDADDPVTKYGRSPYKDFPSADFITISKDDAENILTVKYPSQNGKVFTPYYDSTNNLTILTFDVRIPSDISEGTHTVNFVTKSMNEELCCSSSLKQNDGKERLVEMTKSKSDFSIAVSDRALGDIDGNKRYTPSDATKVLKACAKLAKNEPSGLTDGQYVAADINGDGRLNTTDASAVLQFCGYVGDVNNLNGPAYDEGVPYMELYWYNVKGGK